MKIALFTILGFIHSAFAIDTFPMKEVNFEISTQNVVIKTAEALTRPDEILKVYQPADATVTNKKVIGSEIQFDVSKSILGVRKSAHVIGVLSLVRDDQACSKSLMGYNLSLDISRSSALVSDNIEKLTAVLCFSQKAKSDKIFGHVKGLIHKGSDYGPIVGGVIKSFIDNQIDPLIAALTEVVLQTP